MGQIFNRIKAIARTWADPEPDRGFAAGIDSSDAELKRIIDELSRSKSSESRDGSASNKTSGKQSGASGKMDYETACSVLQISTAAAPEEIKAAYRQRIKEYHPDRVASLGAELRSLAEIKTQQINKAYEFIKAKKGF